MMLIAGGDPYVYSFTSMQPVGPTLIWDSDALGVSFQSDLLMPGEYIKIEMFGTSTFQNMFFTDTATNETVGSPCYSLGWIANAPVYWADGDGAIRVAMQTGSVDLASLTVTDNYSGFEQSNTVPEPSISTLLALGLRGLAARRRRKR